MKKLLAIGVIVLFLGLAIAPSINANVSKASIDSELVEITTELCGLNGGKHTVSLSKEDADEVEKLIDDVKRRLDNVETREETVEVFNEAVVELDKYGLLGGLSVKQAQKLVTGGYQNLLVKRFVGNIFRRNMGIFNNIFCLISGSTTKTCFISFISPIVLFLCELNPDSVNLIILLMILVFFNDTFSYSVFRPLKIGAYIGLGFNSFEGRLHSPAKGWLHTVGLFGIQNMEGDFYGHIFDFISIASFVCIGVIGFTGIKLYKGSECFYLGSALGVRVGPEP